MLVFLSVPTHLIVRPSMLADSTRPCLAWSMNSEYDTASRVVWRASNCFTTVSTTRPMTSQIPTFFKRLFNVILQTPRGDLRQEHSILDLTGPSRHAIYLRQIVANRRHFAETLADQINLAAPVAGRLGLSYVTLVEMDLHFALEFREPRAL